MKAYTSKSTAKRGAIRVISKARGMTQDEVKAIIDDLVTIESHDEGTYFWRLIQNDVNARCAKPKTEAPVDEPEQFENDCRREMAYNETGDAVPADELKCETPDDVGNNEANDDADIVRKSSVEKPTKRVWHIAESMKGARRKDVIEACVNEGIAYYTARTQYQLWYTASKNDAARQA